MPGDRNGPSTNALAAIVNLLHETFGDFTLTELSTLVAACQHEGLSVSSLARVCRFTEATASRTIRKLAPADLPGALPPARGLLTLARAATDSRSRYVFLTPRGRALCRTFDEIIADRRRPPLSGAEAPSPVGAAGAAGGSAGDPSAPDRGVPAAA